MAKAADCKSATHAVNTGGSTPSAPTQFTRTQAMIMMHDDEDYEDIQLEFNGNRPPEVCELIAHRQAAMQIETRIKEVALAYFNLWHRALTKDEDENWGVRKLTYCERQLHVEMFWCASWRYGGYDEGSYEFNMDYSCLDMPESQLLLKAEADRVESERLKALAEAEAKKKAAEREAQRKEEKDREEYK